MSTRTLLIVVALLGSGCGTGSTPAALSAVHSGSDYVGCLPGAEVIGLGGIIVALTADGGPADIDGEGVVAPAQGVIVDRVEILIEPDTVAPADDSSLLQVDGLETAFAAPYDDWPSPVTARPDGRLGPPDPLGWYSLVIAVVPLAPRITIYDTRINYRVGASGPLVGSVGQRWRICVDTGACDRLCPLSDQPDPIDPVPADAQWITVVSVPEPS